MYPQGEIINGYLIQEDLNLGGFANAFRAEKDGEQFFFKVYTSPKPGNGKIFDDYVELQKKIDSRLKKIKKGVLQMKDIFVENNTLYVVYDLMKGKDLLKYEFNALKEKWYVASLFMSSLEKIHKEGLVHTDLKPQQIFVEEDNTSPLKFNIQLADFDFAYIYQNGEILDKPYTIVSTEGYESPEHLKKEDISFESDVFTSAIILYMLLADKFPYDQNNVDTDKLNYNTIGKLRDLDKKVFSEKISDIIYKALNPDKTQRPTAGEIKNALQMEINHKLVKPWEAVSDIEKERKPIRPKTKAPISPVSPVSKPSNVPLPSTNKIKRVELYSNGKRVAISTKSIFTRNLAKTFGSNLHAGISSEQFEIYPNADKTKWFIKGISTAKNPTFYDGQDVTNSETELLDNGTIQVKGIEMKVKLVI